MFIELTDHLRCTADHEESFLVLLPDRMAGRHVVAGSLGCPRCGRVVAIVDGAADFGGPPPPFRPTTLTAPAIAVFLGLAGPGGYVALIGSVGALAREVMVALPGVSLVLVNPPAGAELVDVASRLQAGRLPLKAGSMRGVVLGADHGDSLDWVGAGVAAALAGLRVVVEGPEALAQGLTILAATPTVWVASGESSRRSV